MTIAATVSNLKINYDYKEFIQLLETTSESCRRKTELKAAHERIHDAFEIDFLIKLDTRLVYYSHEQTRRFMVLKLVNKQNETKLDYTRQ